MTANSSRRRVDVEPASSQAQNAALEGQTPYKPLDKVVSSTRFLTIQSASSSDDRISCEVSEIPFGELPVFEALSYQWGDKTAAECILLNGVECKVKQNLLDALFYLRDSRRMGSLLWIDALCIDQENKDERSAQVRLMRAIYYRASRVIVWLGKRYEEYAASLSQLQALGKGPKGEVTIGTEVARPNSTASQDEVAKTAYDEDASSLSLAKDLYRNEYWNRVWIVQEVGLAAELTVCIGNYEADWNSFINSLALKIVGTEGPFRLHKQRLGRHNGSCGLLKLLHEYKDAQCKESRDKVYGLIGLATDARLFPIDYYKSPFEVWKDVMEFAYGRDMFKDDEVISTGSLVKYLLMGKECNPLDHILRPAEETTPIIRNSDSSKGFQVPAKVLGCVRHIGPRPNEIVNDPMKQELWEDKVHMHNIDAAGPAHAESDMLLKEVLRPNGQDLARACFTYSSDVQWPVERYRAAFGLHAHSSNARIVEKLQANMIEPQYGSKPENMHKESGTGVRLYQMLSFFRRKDFRIGLASDQVQLGDLICWVASSSMAIILRPRFDSNTDGYILQAIGTAAVASDLQGTTVEAHRHRHDNFPHGNPTHWKQNDASLTVLLDATFVFIMLEYDRVFNNLAT